jgi:predicted ferric reductase
MRSSIERPAPEPTSFVGGGNVGGVERRVGRASTIERRPTEGVQSRFGWTALVGAYAIPLLLWVSSAPVDVRFATPFASAASIAIICALLGTTGFALNLVLGARLRWVEAMFGGLGPMYAAHRTNGQLAFVLLAGHVALILVSRATVSPGAALALLAPSAGWTVFAGVVAIAAMTVAIGLTVFARLGHEVFVYVQRTFGFTFVVAAYHVFTTEGAKASSPALEWYMAGVATMGLAAFGYRSLFSSLLVRRSRYSVEAVHRLDRSVTEIVMNPGQRQLEFQPGQFVFVSFRSATLAARFKPFEISRGTVSIRPGEITNQFHPFSITSAPHEGALRITVKAVGDYTSALRELEPGAEAIVEGPYGSFTHRSAVTGRHVWIAGGIGVTPFLSMARSLRRGELESVDLYYCVETAAEALFLDELRAIAAGHAGFRVSLIARDEVGFITASVIRAETEDLRSRDVYVCGPPAMIMSLRAQFTDEGVPAERIHAEEFSFARVGGRHRGIPHGRAGQA